MMIANTANCGNLAVHKPHLVPSDGRDCQGRSQQNADVAMMIAQIEDALNPFIYALDKLADAKVLAHPCVHYAIMQEAVAAYPDPEPKLPVPLVLDSTLPRGGWMLVLVAGTVRDG
jgi:hypothetical protein